MTERCSRDGIGNPFPLAINGLGACSEPRNCLPLNSVHCHGLRVRGPRGGRRLHRTRQGRLECFQRPASEPTVTRPFRDTMSSHGESCSRCRKIAPRREGGEAAGPRRERTVIGRSLVVLALSTLNFGTEMALMSQAKVARSPGNTPLNWSHPLPPLLLHCTWTPSTSTVLAGLASWSSFQTLNSWCYSHSFG